MSFKNERFAFASEAKQSSNALKCLAFTCGDPSGSGLLRLTLADAILSLFDSFRPSLRFFAKYFV